MEKDDENTEGLKPKNSIRTFTVREIRRTVGYKCSGVGVMIKWKNFGFRIEEPDNRFRGSAEGETLRLLKNNRNNDDPRMDGETKRNGAGMQSSPGCNLRTRKHLHELANERTEVWDLEKVGIESRSNEREQRNEQFRLDLRTSSTTSKSLSTISTWSAEI